LAFSEPLLHGQFRLPRRHRLFPSGHVLIALRREDTLACTSADPDSKLHQDARRGLDVDAAELCSWKHHLRSSAKFLPSTGEGLVSVSAAWQGFRWACGGRGADEGYADGTSCHMACHSVPRPTHRPETTEEHTRSGCANAPQDVDEEGIQRGAETLG
jgi:hypothetical protein